MMELAIGAMPTNDGIKVLCIGADGACSTREVGLLADGGGLPQMRAARLQFETNFAAWTTSPFETYCEALSVRLPDGLEPRHQVFVATTADGTAVHIPAAALMHALFRPARPMLHAAFTAVNLDHLAHIEFDRDLPIVRIRTGQDAFVAASLKNGAGRYIKWLFASTSGRACSQSAHLRALDGWLDLSLPMGRCRMAANGVRNGSDFYVTALTVQWVEVPSSDNLSGQDEVHFLNNTVPLGSAEELLGEMPAVQDGEWPGLATVLPPEATQNLVGLMFERLRQGYWSRAPEGQVARAGRLLQHWHEKGVLVTLAQRLASMRGGVWRSDEGRDRRLRAPAAMSSEERQMKTNSRSGTLDVFLDTEFSTNLSGEVQLLSLGMCTSEGHEFYAEVALPDAPIAAGQFLEEHVFPQLGRGLGFSGPLIEVGRAMARWLSALGPKLNICYDFSLDYQFVERLVEMVPGELTSNLEPTHIGYLLEDDDGIRAADASWAGTEAQRGLRRHHALADAIALRARFLAVHPG